MCVMASRPENDGGHHDDQHEPEVVDGDEIEFKSFGGEVVDTLGAVADMF